MRRSGSSCAQTTRGCSPLSPSLDRCLEYASRSRTARRDPIGLQGTRHSFFDPLPPTCQSLDLVAIEIGKATRFYAILVIWTKIGTMSHTFCAFTKFHCNTKSPPIPYVTAHPFRSMARYPPPQAVTPPPCGGGARADRPPIPFHGTLVPLPGDTCGAIEPPFIGAGAWQAS